MRFALISDIHGNLPALEAVCADIRRHGCDVVANLGDCLSGSLEPVQSLLAPAVFRGKTAGARRKYAQD
ncbi:MAG: metallophosphoesterase family protein [Eikenella sp.]|nr:metallophosphoesterase family protein [Eikenella sp.]